MGRGVSSTFASGGFELGNYSWRNSGLPHAHPGDPGMTIVAVIAAVAVAGQGKNGTEGCPQRHYHFLPNLLLPRMQPGPSGAGAFNSLRQHLGGGQ